MGKHVIWVEGVDFDETVFDTQKLSVIRGASRALEVIPGIVESELKTLDPDLARIAYGGSQAGFVIEAEGAAIEKRLNELRKDFVTQGREPDDVKPVVDSEELLEGKAPLAHLRIHTAFQKIADVNNEQEVKRAIENARAAIRVGQLREPGLRLRVERKVSDDKPCDFDHTRAAEVKIHGPPTADDEAKGEPSSRYAVSRSSGARWHFGRALRQHIYEKARERLEESGENPRLVFVDDFHEMVENPPQVIWPRETSLRPMPLSVANKIAVFFADGDKFNAIRGELTKAQGMQEGLATMTDALNTYLSDGLKAGQQMPFWLAPNGGTLSQDIDGLLTRLVLGLARSRNSADRGPTVALSLGEGKARWPAHNRNRRQDDKLLRFETLLYGGDDMTFVVPAWLGWWLALAFFAYSGDWSIAHRDKETEKPEKAPMQFSAGLVFASYKTPIRALKKVASDLCRIAKDSDGGLEIEVLESVEPPEEGISESRRQLLGKDWKDDSKKSGVDVSRLFIPRDKVAETYRTLRGTWFGDGAGIPFPTSQVHRALRRARDAGEIDGSGLAGEAARDVALTEIKRYQDRIGLELRALDDANFLPHAGDRAALRLHFLLQQRDYVIAAARWIEAFPELVDAVQGARR